MRRGKSLVRDLQDSSDGTAAYDNAALVASKDAMEFASYIKDVCEQSNMPYNVVLTVYLMTEMLNGGNDQVISTPEAKDIATNLTNDLEGLPVFYHIRVFKLFINRYYLKIMPNVMGNNFSEDEAALSDILINSSKDFKDNINREPSPFEIIYLVCQKFYQGNHNQFSPRDSRVIRKFLNDNICQKAVLNDYIERLAQDFEGKK